MRGGVTRHPHRQGRYRRRNESITSNVGNIIVLKIENIPKESVFGSKGGGTSGEGIGSDTSMNGWRMAHRKRVSRVSGKQHPADRSAGNGKPRPRFLELQANVWGSEKQLRNRSWVNHPYEMKFSFWQINIFGVDSKKPFNWSEPYILRGFTVGVQRNVLCVGRPKDPYEARLRWHAPAGEAGGVHRPRLRRSPSTRANHEGRLTAMGGSMGTGHTEWNLGKTFLLFLY